ncbi:MAG: RNA-binding protein [Phycisphaerae bacterium]|nr:RNA-binding protein [Phycisphaerae bacterium]
MGKKLYVGNLSYSTDSASLENMFSEFGTVESANVIMDRETGRSKGFGFVEFAEESDAQDAITAMDGKDSDGRSLKVNEAKPQVKRTGGFGGGNGGGGGGARRRY